MRQQAGEAETPDPTSDEVAEQDSRAVDIANDDLGQTGATWGQGSTSSQTGGEPCQIGKAGGQGTTLSQTGAAGGLGNATADGAPTAGVVGGPPGPVGVTLVGGPPRPRV